MDLKDHQIIAQNAGTTAGAIVAAEIAAGVIPGWDQDHYEGIRSAVYVGVIDLVERSMPSVVGNAFPGATATAEQFAQVAPAPYEAPPVPQQYAAPPVPQPYPTAPPVPQAAPPQAGGLGPCKGCGGYDFYDDRASNAQKRAGGFKLGSDGKCKGCGKKVWPYDYKQFENRPQAPR